MTAPSGPGVAAPTGMQRTPLDVPPVAVPLDVPAPVPSGVVPVALEPAPPVPPVPVAPARAPVVAP